MENKILVLGIGNILLGDEGVGVHTVSFLEESDLPANVELLDGGTGGFQLLSVIQAYKKVIMIDATLDENKPGSIKVLKPKFAKDFPKSLSAHDIGLKDLLDSAQVLGHLPEIHLVAVTIASYQEINIELSSEIQASLPKIAKVVTELIVTLSNESA